MSTFLKYNLDLANSSQWNMISATTTAKNTLLYLQEVGLFRAGPAYYTTREEYDSFLLKYTLSGAGELQWGGKTCLVPTGKLFWVDCRKWHSYRTAPGEDHWDVIWIHFYGNNARLYYETFLKYNNGEAVATTRNPTLINHLLHSLLALDNSGSNQLEVDLLAADLLTQLVSECTLAAMNDLHTSNVPQIIRDIQIYLQQSFHFPHSLEELGARFNLNPFYLQKQFKRYIGQSPSEYCIYLRVARAKELMRSTYKSISEIAYQVGIDNLGYFTRLFKKMEGLTPQEYRRLWPILETPLSQQPETAPIPKQYKEPD